MRVDTQPSEVLSIVVRMFEKFSATPQSVFDVEETVRIDRGKQIARTYQVDGLMAMWLLEIGVIQFYDNEGNMLATLSLIKNAVKNAVPQPVAA